MTLPARHIQNRLWCALAWIGVLAPPTAHAEQALQACVADVMLAPFAYWKPVTDKPLQPVGLAIDVLNALTTRLNMPPAKVSVLPWRRCLQLVESSKIDLAVNVPTAQIAGQDLSQSEAYYVVHSWYFYSNKIHKSGIRINSTADFQKFRVCGLQGYNYAAYGIDSGAVDSGSHDFRSLLGKLKTNRCDLFIEKREVVAGLYLIDPALGTLFFDPEIDHAPVPQEPENDLRFAFGRKSPQMNVLRLKIDQEIQAMKQAGDIDRMMDKYIQR